ncbi:hypothetical protein NDU88_002486 [Pleurodeles waltl]|uniref:Uncharacterized protein n=1 Tax=Pleurodeles waltl TaxID=8319 RepID=A0AAV7M0Q8_PLEWA|nr:hypothetical protein NDU88_002486 [Pleurodeles waltl]
MTRYCLTQESETVCQRYVLKKKQRKNTVILFAEEQDGAEQYKKRRLEENPLHQMQAVTRSVDTNKESSMGPLASNLDMPDFPALRRLVYRARTIPA